MYLFNYHETKNLSIFPIHKHLPLLNASTALKKVTKSPVARRNSSGWKSIDLMGPSWNLKSCKSFPAVRSHTCTHWYKNCEL